APLAAATLAATSLAAQPPAPAAALPSETAIPPAFGETIDVRVVNVEAVVTDRKGERVRGLTKEDFRLLVDGREMPIEFLTEVNEGGSGAPATRAGAGSEDAGNAPRGR